MSFGMDYQGDMGGGGGFQAGGSSRGGGYSYGGGAGSGGGGSEQGRPRRNYDEQTLIPVCINKILSAKQDTSPESTGNVTLEDGRVVSHQVKLVAAIRTVEDNTTNVLYTVEDCTGMIDVKVWLDDNDCSAVTELREETMPGNMYIKVIGQIREYDNNKQIVANSVRRITKGDELTHHFLEVIYSEERSKRADSIVTPPPMAYPNVSAVSRPLAQQSAGGGLRDEVLSFIKHEGDNVEIGANLGRCVMVLTKSGQFTENEIRKTVIELSDEGHIYSTVNEDHYKCAM